MGGSTEPQRRFSRTKRAIAAGITAFVFLAMGLVLLFMNQLDGGSFVSLLVLGSAITGLMLIWGQVEHLDVYGASFKLKGLESEAERLLEDLKQGQHELYRIALIQTAADGTYRPEKPRIDDRAPQIIALAKRIEEAGLWEPMAKDLAKAAGKLSQNIAAYFHPDNQSPYQFPFVEDEESPQALVSRYDEWLASEHGGSAPEGDKDDPDVKLHQTIEDLRELLDIRRRANEAM